MKAKKFWIYFWFPIILSLSGCGQKTGDGGNAANLKDSEGRTPGQVVLLAYGAALNKDWNAANKHTTETFIGSKSSSSGKKEWASHLKGISAPYDISIVEERQTKENDTVIVILKTPSGDQELELTSVNGNWKLN